MKVLIKFIKRYRSFFISLIFLIIISFFSYNVFLKVINSVTSNILQMLSVLPPIMLMLGLMDVWVPREKLMKYMGNKSGVIEIGRASCRERV